MKTIISKNYKKATDITNPQLVLLPPKNLSQEELISAIRTSIIAENDAVILYETYANSTSDTNTKKIFQDIAEEEKVHVGEFQALLEQIGGKKETEKIKEGIEEAKKLF